MNHQAPRTFQLSLTPCRPSLAPETAPHLGAAYALWQEVSRETYKTLANARRSVSDQFTRQDLVAIVSHEDRCAGLVCFRRTNASSAIDRADSWFEAWPDDLLEGLGREHPRGLIMSFLMVHPDYRRASAEAAEGVPSVSEMVVKLASLVFLESGAQLGYGMTRNNRGVNKLAQSAGWKPVAQGVRHIGYDADLVVLSREAAQEAGAAFDEPILKLWSDRVHHADPCLFPTKQTDAK